MAFDKWIDLKRYKLELELEFEALQGVEYPRTTQYPFKPC